MKSFLDTSVLIATFHVDHPHHKSSFDLFVRCQKDDACCGLHSLAEVYGTLTGMRVASRRASGEQFVPGQCQCVTKSLGEVQGLHALTSCRSRLERPFRYAVHVAGGQRTLLCSQKHG